MEALIITHKGTERVGLKEISEKFDNRCVQESGAIIAQVTELSEVCKFCYSLQSARKVLFLLEKASSFSELVSKLSKIDLSQWVSDSEFAVRSQVIENNNEDSKQIEREIGEVIFERYKEVTKVNLENPLVTFFVYVFNDKYYCGIDFAGFDLSKRSYKLFYHSDSIKATIAHALIHFAGFNKDKVLLDPFCQSGTIAIEAAFKSTNKPIRFYEKDNFAFLKFPLLKDVDFDVLLEGMDSQISKEGEIFAFDFMASHIKAAEKNAKIAGLNKAIKFSRTEVEFLDTKFEKESVDCIVTNPPKPSRETSEKKLAVIFKEFFYTAEFILKKDGKIVLFAKKYTHFLREAQRYNFDLAEKVEVLQGKETFNILIFQKVK